MTAVALDPISDLLVGTLLGRYLLTRRLGEGGMGAVYEATDKELGRRVAIKTLHERHAQSSDVRARFLREGQAASRVQHPNVANVYDVGRGSCPYLVMEFLEGEDLGRLIAREGPLSVQRTADLLLPVVAAVAAAHDLGILHRDLKPDNIFLSAERNTIKPKVLDFGISKIADQADSPTLTSTGAFLGTPHYVSPEQAQGARYLDDRSDQYSLGVILYQCTTGRRPMEDCPVFVVLQRIVAGDFPAPRTLDPRLPSAFEAVIVRAMARDPAQRFPTTRAFGRALLEFASDAVRASHAGELGSEPDSPTAVDGSTERAHPIVVEPVERTGLGTTLAHSVLQREAPRKVRVPFRWFGAGALLLASIVGFFTWRTSTSSAPQRPLSTNTNRAASDLAQAPSPVPISTQTPVPERQARKRLVSEPLGASVWNGVLEVGKTPLVLDVPADAPLEVELRFPGYESNRRQISKADPKEVRVALKRKRPLSTQTPSAPAAVPQSGTLADRPSPYAEQK